MPEKQTAAPTAEETPPPARATKKATAAPPPAEAVVSAPIAKTPPPAPVPPSAPMETSEPTAESRPETAKRRMPEHLRKYLLKLQGGNLYLPAAYRIVWFRDEYPDWGISTTLIEGGQADGYATVQANIFNAEGRLIASGMKTETKQDFPAGWVEKAESGSISRALAVAGFGTQFMPELDEGGPEGEPAYAPRNEGSFRSQEAAAPRPAFGGERPAALPASEIWEGPGQCPRCHAPEGRRHAKPCLG